MKIEQLVEIYNSGNINDVDIKKLNFYYLFIDSCKFGHLNIAKWLWKIPNNTINLHTDSDFAFVCSCSNGHLEIAKWLWEVSNYKINIRVKNDRPFRWTCYYGHLHVAKWLWEISNYKINIHAKDKDAFKISYKKGHIYITKWLWYIFIKHTDNEYNICNICLDDNTTTIKNNKNKNLYCFYCFVLLCP